MSAATYVNLAIVNAHVAALDARRSHASPLTVRGGRISIVGPVAEVRREIGPGTRVADAGGRLIVPGFNDSHVHFLQGGFQLSSVDLRSAVPPESLRNVWRSSLESSPEAAG